ncbi:carotenoid oxygenase family protein [Enhygromyxa salina]|nr:carotenoid oxygenase family protein [Enhygromyxa salina]
MASARDFIDGDTYSSQDFAPVERELDHPELELLEGELPPGLQGVFARNSSNPRFVAPEPYHWFDGDGMVHAVSFADGRASYRNRWVRTAGLAEDEAAGRATWTGLLSRPDFTRAGGPYKNTANTDLLYWNGRLLALWWMGGGLPHALTVPELETEGPWPDAGTMTAHAKVDPRSGDLVFLDYAPTPPFATHGTLTTDGQLTRTPIELPGPRPQHDLALTERYTILLDVSMFADPEALTRGKVHMRFFPDRPTRVGLFDRKAHRLVRWFEVPACYVYHFANAWEQGREVIVTVCRMRDPLMYQPQPGRTDRVVPRISHLRLEPELVRWTLDLDTGLAREELIDSALAEFPRIDDRRLGSPTDAAFLGTFAEQEAFRFDGVRRVELGSGAAIERKYPAGWYGGEVSVAPLGPDPDDAVLVTFVSELGSGRSELWLLSARELDLVAKLAIPSRVPAGFHTRFIPGEACRSTRARPSSPLI